MRGIIIVILLLIFSFVVIESDSDIVYVYARYMIACTFALIGIIHLFKSVKQDNEYVEKAKAKEYREYLKEQYRLRNEEAEKEAAFWAKFPLKNDIDFQIDGIENVTTINGYSIPIEVEEEIYVQLNDSQKKYYQRSMKKTTIKGWDYQIPIYVVRNEFLRVEKKERAKVEYGETIEF